MARKDTFKLMNDPQDNPTAQDAYDALAESYAALVDTKPHNAYYERPATLSLLPEVQGKRVLDAGCGSGFYAEWLLDRGAEVVAFDANEKMVAFTRARVGDRAQVVQADLGEPLDFLEDAAFDIVLSPLTMDYVEDWRSTFAEFHRVLKAGGHLIFSMEHPYAKYGDHRETSTYFETERVEYVWTGFGQAVRVPSYRRPLSEVLNPLIEAGFTLERIVEPLPTEDFRERSPEEYERLIKEPGFLGVRAVKGRL